MNLSRKNKTFYSTVGLPTSTVEVGKLQSGCSMVEDNFARYGFDQTYVDWYQRCQCWLIQNQFWSHWWSFCLSRNTSLLTAMSVYKSVPHEQGTKSWKAKGQKKTGNGNNRLRRFSHFCAEHSVTQQWVYVAILIYSDFAANLSRERTWHGWQKNFVMTKIFYNFSTQKLEIKALLWSAASINVAGNSASQNYVSQRTAHKKKVTLFDSIAGCIFKNERFLQCRRITEETRTKQHENIGYCC